MTIERQRTNPRTPSTGRVLRNVSHGGEGGSGRRLAACAADTASDAAVSDTAFNYMFTTLAEEFPAHHLPNTDPAATVAALKRLGAAMVEDPASRPTPSRAPRTRPSRRSTPTGASSSTTT